MIRIAEVHVNRGQGGNAQWGHRPVVLGLRENRRQFALLVLVNAFVGAMVGLERAVLPLLADETFGLASHTAILSFIASFGLAKALANVLAGRWGDRYGRKRVLVAGWLFGLPVPFLVMWAPSWGWITFANVLLGINQGLAWSSTVIMKIDLVGPRQRGLAMGLNEAAGYVAVSLAALASGYVAGAYALRPQPFYLGVAFALAGLLLSVGWVRETRAHARLEARERAGDDGGAAPSFARVLLLTSWKDRTLFAVSQTGMVNNLNDGMAWGLFPLYFAALGLRIEEIGLLAALYPAVWGLGQLGTGALSDRLGRKPLIVAGMWVQAVGIALLLAGTALWTLASAMVLLGLGTALVYPTLLAAISDVAHPSWRASAVGVYRLWRDGGYVVGALLAGLLADTVGLRGAIGAIGLLTALSGGLAALVMRETLHAPPNPGTAEGGTRRTG
ncbi:MAG: MFS transporter [Rhodothermaceae bacterium]|nr:MAG: MFS transporter [Rhodothermaceae bacterium]